MTIINNGTLVSIIINTYKFFLTIYNTQYKRELKYMDVFVCQVIAIPTVK